MPITHIRHGLPSSPYAAARSSAPPCSRCRSRAPSIHRAALAVCLALGVAQAHAQSSASDASALSAVPIGVSVAASGLLLSAGATFVIVSVEASGNGAVWVMEQASNGVRTSVRVAAQDFAGLSVAVGTAVTVSAISTGWVLSAASQAIAFIPNEIGMALLYNERITR